MESILVKSDIWLRIAGRAEYGKRVVKEGRGGLNSSCSTRGLSAFQFVKTLHLFSEIRGLFFRGGYGIIIGCSRKLHAIAHARRDSRFGVAFYPKSSASYLAVFIRSRLFCVFEVCGKSGGRGSDYLVAAYGVDV